MTGLICCTLECNLACEYCFEGNGKTGRCPDVDRINNEFEASIPLLDKFIDELYIHNKCNSTTVIWHGGEPTLIRPELLSVVMEKQEKKKHNIRWAIQTNGTILNNKFLEMYKTYDVNIGISLDGIRESHDKYRVTKNRKPTFDIICKNIDKLINYGITPNILLTINNENVRYLKEIYNFIVCEKKLNFSFNALYPNNHDQNVELNNDIYSEAICNLFDIWINDNDNKKLIIPFLRIIEGLMYPQYGISVCHWRKNCSKTMIAIDVKGDLYHCEHWVDKDEFCLGNIREGFEKCINSDLSFTNRLNVLDKKECGKCEIYKLCYGGCPSNAYELFGDINNPDESICKGRKLIVKHIYNVLKNNTKYPMVEFTRYGRDEDE